MVGMADASDRLNESMSSNDDAASIMTDTTEEIKGD